MRKVGASAFVLGVLGLIAVNSAAAPPNLDREPLPSSPKPALQISFPPVIKELRVKAITPIGSAPVIKPYADGPIVYEALVTNPNNAPLSTNLIVDHVTGVSSATVATVPINIGPKLSAWISFGDAKGLNTSCGATKIRLRLESQPAESGKYGKITPSCIFATEGVDPTAGTPPDTKAAQRKNKAYYYSPSVVGPVSCQNKMTVKATLKNENMTAVNAKLLLNGPDNDDAASGAALALTMGKDREVSAKINSFDGLPGNYALKIDANGPSYQVGWYAKLSRGCTLAVELE